jgi:general secretion pathway protein J
MKRERLQARDRRSARGAGQVGAAGFTLLELLVAIGIMALVATIAWRGLASLIATRDRLAPETDDVRSLLAGFGQMQLDLAQAVNPALISLGGSPVRVLAIDGVTALQVVRLAPPLLDCASAVQQVTYSVQDGSLLRQATVPARSLAALATSVPAGVRLIAGVTSIQVRVWRANQGWVVPADADPVTPPGVEVEIVRSDGARYRRVMVVG